MVGGGIPVKMKNISEIGVSCVGCFGCIKKCPVNAITKRLSQDGFEYPVVDSNICINCGICMRSCPVNILDKLHYPKSTYLTISKDQREINSSSGGLFLSIAKKFIEEFHGYVVGCILDERHMAKHIMTNNLQEVFQMQGSKYVESDIEHIYYDIKEKLDENKKVLFSGTPCQCASVKKFCREDKNLFCIDIVCHGVPSKKLWDKEIQNLQIQYDFDKITFRYKDKYEKTGFSLSLYKNNKLIKRIPYTKDGYYSLFMKSRTFRKSCYECKYACSSRISDITMGDCNTWLDYNDFYPEKSLSIALINTNKGHYIWNIIKSDMQYIDLDYEHEQKQNKQLSSPSCISNRF